jgi:tetratricopeptide (TPR) repeat protein
MGDLIRLSAILIAAFFLAQSPVDLVRQKRYAEARRALAGISEPSDRAQAIAFHRVKAAIASGLGEHKAAADEMNRALAFAPGDSALLLATAVAELQAGLLDAALEHAQRVESAPGQALTGDIQEKRGLYVEAARAYQRAVALAPEAEAYRVALASELVQHATFEPAIKVLEQAAPLFPGSSKIRALLGIARYATGDTGGARSAMVDAIQADPHSEAAYRYLARFVLDSNETPAPRETEVLCQWDRTVCAALKLRSDASDPAPLALLQTDSSAIGRCELARYYERSERWREARRPLEQCVLVEPSPQNHYRMGRLYSKLGLREKAAAEMRLYREASRRQSEEAARREQAVAAFQVVTH